MTATTKVKKKSLDSLPDETRSFEKGKIDLANLGDITIGRGSFEPGWSWEKCIKPIVKTNSCQVRHTMYIISGRMNVIMDDGTQSENGPGDVAVIPPGMGYWRRTLCLRRFHRSQGLRKEGLVY